MLEALADRRTVAVPLPVHPLSHTPNPRVVWLDGCSETSLDDFFALSQGAAQLGLTPAAWAGLLPSRQLLESLVADQRRIYGVTTGYGPLACQHVSPEAAEDLQRNLIYHLASGVGPEYGKEQTRAILAARIINLSRGYSAVRPATVQFLLTCLREDLLPCVPQIGTVGASGDLTPLAHLALGWLGEGMVHYKGERMPAADALSACGLEPLTLTYKEGLALVNGTSAMSAIAARNAVLARRAMNWSLRLSCGYAEVLGGKLEAWDERLGQVRPHPGQQWAAAQLRQHSRGSSRLEASKAPPRIDFDQAREGVIDAQPLLQDPYSIRCLPQIYGAVSDVLDFHDSVIRIELNSVSDNPIFFPDNEAFEPQVLHGGNFFGQHVAFASDSLHMAVIQMGVHIERKIARLTDASLNQGLPAFLQPLRNGVQSGFMGAQVSATSLVAEMRSEATPASIQSIPTNANNQDIVPMGTIAARKTAKALDHLFRLLAIDAMVIVQAMELRQLLSPLPDSGFSSSSKALAAWLRRSHAALSQDRPLGGEIESLSHRMQEASWPTNSPKGIDPNS